MDEERGHDGLTHEERIARFRSQGMFRATPDPRNAEITRLREALETAEARGERNGRHYAISKVQEYAREIRENATRLGKYESAAQEARCRELAAMYVDEAATAIKTPGEAFPVYAEALVLSEERERRSMREALEAAKAFVADEHAYRLTHPDASSRYTVQRARDCLAMIEAALGKEAGVTVAGETGLEPVTSSLTVKRSPD